MAKNGNLHHAKKEKNDEFYTQLTDIEKELKHYKHHFKDKVVFCNCDDPEYSNFWQYFSLNFEPLGLKKLISTHYEKEKQSYKLEMWKDEAGVHTDIKTLKQNGDFRSPECIELLKEADIVVTNPPFSCYSSDTEVMTNNGWKLIKNVDINTDKIMSLNPKTNFIEMVKAVDFIESPVNGELMHFHSRNYDFCVTSNHKMLSYYKNGKGENKLMPLTNAEDIKKTHLLPISGFKWEGKHQEYFILPQTTQCEQYSRREIIVPPKKIPMNDWLEFFGFWLADGCYRDHINSFGKRDYSISIKQNIENEDYVLDLIKRIGFKAEISGGSSGKNRNYNIYSKQLWEYLSQFGRSGEKYIPREFLDLDIDSLKALYKGYINRDGSLVSTGQTHFSTASEKLIENIQELILKIYGRISQTHKRVRKHSYDDNYGTSYEIFIKLNKNSYNFSKYGIAEKVAYKDNVYCLTLERNHVMLTRHNGIIGWCGNCFREYVAQLMEYDKKFIILGNINAVTYKEFFPLIKDNKVWAGFSFNKTMEFIMPDDYELKGKAFIDENGKKHGFVPSISWYTNLDIKKRHEELILFRKYKDEPERYPKYDNYDAINVDKVADIPVDYEPCWYKCSHSQNCLYAQTEGKENNALCKNKCNGEIGVPITFLDKYSSEQFDIIGADYDLANPVLLANGKKGSGRFYVNYNSHKENCEQSEQNNRTTEQQNNRTTEQQKNGRTDYTAELSFENCHKCNGIIGVPITFLDKYNPNQFIIIGLDRYIKDNPRYGHRFTINERETYARILIKKKMQRNYGRSNLIYG